MIKFRILIFIFFVRALPSIFSSFLLIFHQSISSFNIQLYSRWSIYAIFQNILRMKRKNFNTAVQREATTADLLPSLQKWTLACVSSSCSIWYRMHFTVLLFFMKFRNFSTFSVSRLWYHHIHISLSKLLLTTLFRKAL